jgi:hypothetical protein
MLYLSAQTVTSALIWRVTSSKHRLQGNTT